MDSAPPWGLSYVRKVTLPMLRYLPAVLGVAAVVNLAACEDEARVRVRQPRTEYVVAAPRQEVVVTQPRVTEVVTVAQPRTEVITVAQPRKSSCKRARPSSTSEWPPRSCTRDGASTGTETAGTTRTGAVGLTTGPSPSGSEDVATRRPS